MRLEKYLVIRGLGSRRVIIEKVKNGDISVNGIQVFDERIDVYEDDKILYADSAYKSQEIEDYLKTKNVRLTKTHYKTIPSVEGAFANFIE
mgnify:CR=1 FL=1